jgi:Zinc dependent phospholipase C
VNCKLRVARGLKHTTAFLLALIILLVNPVESDAYSVMAHQAIVDSAWDANIKPALKKRFPNATEEDLRTAKAYSYGGAIIQDLGYYPGGNPFFSDLTHYVRSGDFVLAMLRDAQNLQEYAFAVGSMAHYAADNKGHRDGVNRAVPVLYPKLKKKYGESVSYEQDKLAHIKTEFGFDVLEVAKGRYAPQSYHDFIGFQVAPRVLEQAFQETYGLDLKEVLKNEDHVLNSYRHAVSDLLPKATRIAWDLKEDDIQKDQPGITKRKFLYNLKRSSYEKEWGKDYEKPTFGDKVLALIYKILPKFGPLKVLQFKTPTPETEHMFERSFNETMDLYRELLKEERENGKPELKNDNFDLGEVSLPGQYKLSDTTYAKLLDKLAEAKFTGMTPEMRAELLDYFGGNTAFAMKKDKKAWAKLQAELEELKNTPAEQKAATAAQ